MEAEDMMDVMKEEDEERWKTVLVYGCLDQVFSCWHYQAIPGRH